MSFFGTFESLSNVGIYLDIDPMIQLLDPFDVPLQSGVDANGVSALAESQAFEIKVEWLEEVGLTPRATLGTATSTDAFITVLPASATPASRLRFQSNDIILVDSEIMLVTGQGSTADTLTVTRAIYGPAAAAHSTGAAVVGLGSYAVEGGDPTPARAADRANVFNYLEIFGPYAVTVSETTRAIRKYGIADEFDHQAMMRLREGGVAYEQALLYGTRNINTASAAVYARAMGGMISYITTNVNSSTTALTEPTLLDQMQSCFDVGGNPDRAVMGSKNKRILSGFTSFGQIQVMRPDGTRGVKVDTYISDFGQVLVVLDRWCRTADLFIFERDQAEMTTLRPFQLQPLAKTGDATKGMVIGEKSLRFFRQKHAARFSALT